MQTVALQTFVLAFYMLTGTPGSHSPTVIVDVSYFWCVRQGDGRKMLQRAVSWRNGQRHERSFKFRLRSAS